MPTASLSDFDETPTEMTMPFGKHRGVPLSQIEDSYLRWVKDADRCSPELFTAVNAELDRRTSKAPAREPDRHKVPSTHSAHVMDLARLIVDTGANELQEAFGLDIQFTEALEFLRRAILLEPITDDQRPF
jgi:hypothetical protein